jgi:ribosomal protein S18 acetylase RimI-like enzyme
MLMVDQYMTARGIILREVSVRAMRHSDLATVIELDVHVFGSARPAYFERRLAVLEDGDARTQAIFLVADYRDEVIGFVMGILAYGEFGLAQVTAIVDTIAVHPLYQRQGIGQRLIEAFTMQSASLGAATVYTLVNWDNWILLKVFHALGFSLASTIPLERRIDQPNNSARQVLSGRGDPCGRPDDEY